MKRRYVQRMEEPDGASAVEAGGAAKPGGGDQSSEPWRRGGPGGRSIKRLTRDALAEDGGRRVHRRGG